MVSKVKQSEKKYNFFDIFIPTILAIIIALIAINPQKYSETAYNGIIIWAKVLIPTLFPFFVLSKLFTSCNLVCDISNIFKPITKRLFKSPPITAYVFFMSIITGYPVGCKLISDLYKNGQISKQNAKKAISFCSNSGPMFILGSVGIGMFSNAKIGYTILLCHILGAIINGMIYRGKLYDLQQNEINTHHKKTSFSESVTESISSILLIGGVICFSFVVIEIITTSFLFNSIVDGIAGIGINKNIIISFFSGLCEITKGCLLVSSCGLTYQTSTMLCCFIISFGGVSTILQSTAFTQNIISIKGFVFRKFTHAIISTILSCLFILLFW